MHGWYHRVYRPPVPEKRWMPSANQDRRAIIAWFEFEVPEAPPVIATFMAIERSLFRRIQGRVFSRVN